MIDHKTILGDGVGWGWGGGGDWRLELTMI